MSCCFVHCRDCFHQSCCLTKKDLGNKYCYFFPNRMTNRLFSCLELLNLLPYGLLLSEKLYLVSLQGHTSPLLSQPCFAYTKLMLLPHPLCFQQDQMVRVFCFVWRLVLFLADVIYKEGVELLLLFSLKSAQSSSWM